MKEMGCHEIFTSYGPEVHFVPPWGVKEGSDELGAHGNIAQCVNIYDRVKFRENLTESTFP